MNERFEGSERERDRNVLSWRQSRDPGFGEFEGAKEENERVVGELKLGWEGGRGGGAGFHPGTH